MSFFGCFPFHDWKIKRFYFPGGASLLFDHVETIRTCRKCRCREKLRYKGSINEGRYWGELKTTDYIQLKEGAAPDDSWEWYDDKAWRVGDEKLAELKRKVAEVEDDDESHRRTTS